MIKRVLSYVFAIVAVTILCPSQLIAQKFEFIPFGGYQTSAKLTSYEDGKFRINDGLNFGASVNYQFGGGYKVEFTYSRQPSSLTYTVDGTTDDAVKMAVNYYSLGGLVEIFQGDPVVPFISAGIGGTYYNPENPDTDSENVMHFNIGSGAKFYFNDHFGVRLQARLLLPVFFEGIYFEEGAPDDGEGMQTKIAGVQGDFTAGVILRF
jgi:hypothetical protein